MRKAESYRTSPASTFVCRRSGPDRCHFPQRHLGPRRVFSIVGRHISNRMALPKRTENPRVEAHWRGKNAIGLASRCARCEKCFDHRTCLCSSWSRQPLSQNHRAASRAGNVRISGEDYGRRAVPKDKLLKTSRRTIPEGKKWESELAENLAAAYLRVNEYGRGGALLDARATGA